MGSATHRLDGPLWQTTALGVSAPNGVLRGWHRDHGMAYRPLTRSHLLTSPLAEELDRSVSLIDDRAGWDRFLDDPEVVRRRGSNPPTPWPGGLAVVVRDRSGRYPEAVLRAQIDPDDGRKASLSALWTWNAAWLGAPDAAAPLAAGFVTLFRALAQRGVLAVIANETWLGPPFLRAVRELGGFRPVDEVLAEHGLSPADEFTVICEWRATVEDDDVIDFATREALTPEAEHELRRLVLAHLRAYPRPWHGPAADHDDAPPGPYRCTIGGDVRLDGLAGTGSGYDDDWHHPPPDLVDLDDQRSDLRAWKGPDPLARGAPGPLSRPLEGA